MNQSWTMSSQVQHLFLQHQDLLQNHYPGISERRILQELFEFLPRIHLSYEEFIQSSLWDEDHDLVHQFTQYLQEGVPLEYIVGKKFFYDGWIYLAPGVFIPRSETELLVEKTIHYLKQKKPKSSYQLLDVCTGPGTILLTILKNCPFLSIQGVGIDQSPLALEWALKNEQERKYMLSPNHSCRWVQSDRLAKLIEENHALFDVIVSNPPYIPLSLQEQVHSQVHDHEPHDALYLRDDEYDQWFQVFFTQVKRQLKPGGFFMMEGHENCLQKLQKIGKFVGLPSLSIQKDLLGNGRFLMTESIE